MTKENFLKLVERVREGNVTEHDIYLYNTWFNKFQSANEWYDEESGTSLALKNLIEGRINEQIDRKFRSKIIKPLWTALAAAASILLFISFGGYYFLHKGHSGQITYKNDVVPGRNQLTLTLANGQKFLLTKGLYKKLAQGNVSIQINNAITYKSDLKGDKVDFSYNTLSTSIGEQSPYPLILADGTKVWLDAESSITFPVVFSGKDRIVKITGEAYFEVAHNNSHPFKVAVKNQMVEDIGTHFNINAYDDKNGIKTTLFEGAVKISVPSSSSAFIKAGVILIPGQQSVLNNSALNVTNADMEKVLAWKNGYFRFNHENIRNIMLELSRWYNIDVQYSGTSSDEEFYATISRNRNISDVLNMLENTKGVHFKIEGRRVTVMQ